MFKQLADNWCGKGNTATYSVATLIV